MEAVVLGLKVVGTAIAAKTMIDGIREGNLLKAVLGGVGAYMGASSLMAGAAAKGATTAAQVGSDSFAATAAGAANAPAEGFLAAGMPAAKDAIGEQALQATAGTASVGGMTANDLALAAGTATDRVATTTSLGDKVVDQSNWVDRMLNQGGKEAGKEGGFLDFANENPALVQVGLGALGGYAQGQTAQNVIEERQRREDEARRRTGTTFATEGLTWQQPRPHTIPRPMGAR